MLPRARAWLRKKGLLDWTYVVLGVLAALVVLAGIVIATAPLFVNPTTHGIHDWDQMESHRYLVVKTIREFRQFPFWNPYACGGFNAWGAIEGDTSLVSP